MLAAAYSEREGEGGGGEQRGQQGLAPLQGARALQVSHMVNRWLPTAGESERAGGVHACAPAFAQNAAAW